MTHWAVQMLIDALEPPTRLLVSDWADRYRVLSNVASATPGRWTTARTPYLREIMDRCSAWKGGEVVFMKAAQVGGTEAINNVVGYAIDQDPAPMIQVMPTEQMAKRNSKTRIQPMINNAPVLARRVSSSGKGNTTLEKEFVGGVWVAVGANAPAALRSMPCKRGLIDEEDGCPVDCGGEGDPVELVRARLQTYQDSLLIRVSTPTLAQNSRIVAGFENSDQRFYHVPCPHCGHRQKLEWEQMRWDDDDPATAAYECIGCGERIVERHKAEMLAAGEWVPENPGHRVTGFHLNGLYSPLGWLSWAEMVHAWLLARNNEVLLKAFMNIKLGLPFKARTDVPDWEELAARETGYRDGEVPTGVGVLTAGVDVQKNRIEMEVVGWGQLNRSWSVHYVVIRGDTADTATWARLGQALERPYLRRDGRVFQIEKCGLDTGYQTQNAYRFAQQHPALVLPLKGQANSLVPIGQASPIEITEAGRKLPGGIKLWPVGVNLLKQELYGWLRLTDQQQSGYCRFPEDRDPEWFRQLTAEEMVLKSQVTTAEVWQWRKVRDRNEALDCRIYARAAAMVRGVDRVGDETWAAKAADGVAAKAVSGRVGTLMPNKDGVHSTGSRRAGGRYRVR